MIFTANPAAVPSELGAWHQIQQIAPNYTTIPHSMIRNEFLLKQLRAEAADKESP